MLRNTFARVHLGAIAHNISELRKAAGTDVLAVVKANAYGHGMEQVAQTAEDCGVRWFAVATADEAVALREQTENHILVLSPVQADAEEALVCRDISLCVCSAEQLARLAAVGRRVGRPARAHIKCDTGMGRVGLRTATEMEAVLHLFRQERGAVLEGIFTHFATADEADLAFAQQQVARFASFCQMAQAAGFAPLRHAANSAAIVALPAARLDLCRMGISMYGYPPARNMDMRGVTLRPAMELVSCVSFVKAIHPGDTVSYGRLFTARRETQVATVPVGYADGYPRACTGKAQAEVGGMLVPVIGRVCMDQVMLDVTGMHVREGDTVRLMGDRPGITADDLAAWAGTISYEVLSCITARVPRIYADG